MNHPHRRLTFIVIYINISTRITRIHVCVCESDSYFNIKTDGPAAAGCILLRGPKRQDMGGGVTRSKCGSAVVGGRRQSRCACSLGVAGGVSPRRRRRPTTTAAVPVLILRPSASAHVFCPTSPTHPPAHDCIFTHRAVVVSVEIIRPFRLPNTATPINARNVYTRARQRP